MSEEQVIAAADSLAVEINELCRNQPSGVVMTALAALTAFGLIHLRTNDSEMEEALDHHVAFIKYWIKRHESKTK